MDALESAEYRPEFLFFLHLLTLPGILLRSFPCHFLKCNAEIMRITEAHFFCDLIILEACLPEELLCTLHTDSGKHFREGSACGLFEKTAETAGTDVQIVTDIV